MWPNNKLTSLLGIDVPIVQAPMILQKPLVPLAAAVSNAGGLGSLGCAEMEPDELETRVAELRAATARPFNLNFFLHSPPVFDAGSDARFRDLVEPLYNDLGLDLPRDANSTSLSVFGDDMLRTLLRLRPAMVSFHFGCPAAIIVERLKAAGIVTAATATCVAEAVQLEKAGLDVVVAQGWEAGGHRGSFVTNSEEVGIGTMALVPQIVDAVSVPVAAAGGIGDGRGIAAALALGAVGVWLGTAFLSCIETPITPQHRAALLSARDEDTQLSRAFSGRPCRAKRNSYTDEVGKTRPTLQDFPLMYNYSSPLKTYGIDNRDLNFQFLLYGQAASLNAEMSAAQLIARLTTETKTAFQRLTV